MLAMNDQQLQMEKQTQLMLNPSSQMMNSHHHPRMMNQNHQLPLMNHSSTQMMNQKQLPVLLKHPHIGMNQNYGLWGQQQVAKPSVDSIKYQNFGSVSQSSSVLARSNNWKGKKGMNSRKDGRRNEQKKKSMVKFGPMSSVVSVGGGYKTPTLQELQYQDRAKARRFYPKKNFSNRFAPYAPRNTTSFIIRAKKSGGIASLVSPYAVTPAVLPTPKFSPSREVLGDMAKEEWGVDGYGSMKGLIRLRSPGIEADIHDEGEDEDAGSSESDVEEHVEVERRLDQDLSRFEMIYPTCDVEYNNLLENRVDDQDTHIAQLEEENLILKQRLFLMERELGDMRRRLQHLDGLNPEMDDLNEEVVENGSDNESECCVRESIHSKSRQTNHEVSEDVSSGANAGGGADDEVVDGEEGVDAVDDVSAEKKNEDIVNACMRELVIASHKEDNGEETSKCPEETFGSSLL